MEYDVGVLVRQRAPEPVLPGGRRRQVLRDAHRRLPPPAELGYAFDAASVTGEVGVQVELGDVPLDHHRQVVGRDRVGRGAVLAPQETVHDLLALRIELVLVVEGPLLETSGPVAQPLHRPPPSVRLNALKAAATCLGLFEPDRTSDGNLPARK